jgi:predicted RNA-binding Zn-ribbon protein involved in translation (DUF1610 family)
MSNRSALSKNFAVISLGLLTTISTGIILGQLQAKASFLIYSYLIYKIVPVGAILSGCLATSGYVWGVKIMHPRVDRFLAVQMAVSGFLAYIIANFLDYLSHEEEDVLAREAISFWQYWQLSIDHAMLSSLRSSSSSLALGELGYFYAVLQIAGFIGGGVVLFWLLKDAIYCDECAIDLKRRTVQERYTREPLRTLRQKLRVFKNKLTTEPPIAAISYHAKEMGTTRAVNTHLRTRVIVHKCDLCGVSHLQCDTERSISNKYWSGLPLTRIIHWYKPENSHSRADR